MTPKPNAQYHMMGASPHAVIIGGGIGGSAIGIALRRLGHSVDVYEGRSAAEGDAGAFLNLAPNGVHAANALGAGERLRKAGFHSQAIRFYNAQGRYIAELDSRDEARLYGAENMTMKRADLSRLLREEAQELGAEFLYSKRCVGVRIDSDGRPVALFDDGTSAAGDLLIGCDGIRSSVRRSTLEGAPDPRYTGLMDCGGYARLQPGEIEPHVQHMTFGRRAFFGYVARPDGEIWWFSNVPEPNESVGAESAQGGSAEWLERLGQLHRDDPEPIPSILRSTVEVVGRWPLRELPPVPRWHSGRVCIIGDAAHATLPHAGQGASLALEDAVVLAQCLQDARGVEEAFEVFQKIRKSRVDRISAQARRSGGQKMPGPLQARIRDLLLPVLLKAGMKQAAETYRYRAALETGVGA